MDDLADVAGSRVPAVSRALLVIDVVAASGPVTLAVLARRCRLPKSTLLGICATLVEERLLRQDEQGRYAIGLGLVELAAAELAAPRRLTRLGIFVPDWVNRFYVVEAAAAEKAAGELRAEVVSFDAGNSVQRQVEQMTQAAGEGCDALVVDAVHSLDIAAGVQRARAAGVTVIAVNVGAQGADATVTTDNVQAGQVVGHHLASLADRCGPVAIVDGLAVTATADRVAGFMSALREYPQMHVVAHRRGDHSRTAGHRVAAEILAVTPNLVGIFGINDPTSLGIADAVAEAGRRVAVVSVDGAASAVSSIADGSPLRATAAQDPARLGRLAVRLAAQVSAGRAPSGRVQLLPTQLVTALTVNEYEPWG